jgi:MFS family permease
MNTNVPAKRWMHIIPVAMVMYILAYMDRINVAMVLPYVDKSFGLNSADAGFAAGIFFVGYMVLQIPGGILAGRYGARRVVAILMVLWSLSAMATGMVRSQTELYVVRFVVGIFEGGVWPSVLVLLATWFPQRERARANALWMICMPASAVIMAPVTGWLLTMVSWRWVFILEGLPPLIWVVVWWFLIADRPSSARWISLEERMFVEDRLSEENNAKPPTRGYAEALTNRQVLSLAVAYFFWMAGMYGFTMWAPTVVKSFTHAGGSSMVGWISAIPFAFALVAMIVNSVWSDRRMERQAHVWVPLAVGVVGLIGGQFAGHSPLLELVFLILTGIGVYAPFGPFWAIPSALMSVEVVGAGIGIINAIGNLGGFAGPYMVGYIQGATHNGLIGQLILAMCLFITGVITCAIGGKRTTQRRDIYGGYS